MLTQYDWGGYSSGSLLLVRIAKGEEVADGSGGLVLYDVA